MRGTSLWEISNQCFTIPMLLSLFIAPIHLSAAFVLSKKSTAFLVQLRAIISFYSDFQLKYEKLTSSLLKLDSLLTVNFHIKMLAYTFAIVHYLPRDIFNIEKKI